MAVETAADLEVFFNTDEFAKGATYTPPGGGSAAPCSILIGDLADDDGEKRAEFRGAAPATGFLVSVLKTQVEAPAAGGVFAVGSSIYTIVGAPALDDTGAIWRCRTA